MGTATLNQRERKALKDGLLETQKAVAHALEKLEEAETLTWSDALQLMMGAVQPTDDAVREHLARKLLAADMAATPSPATSHTEYIEDAYALHQVVTKIAETIFDAEAFDAARQDPKRLDDLIETALVTCINLRDFILPTWPRVTREHLARGYEIVAAGRYVLYGETRGSVIFHDGNPEASGPVELPLPRDIENFPQLPKPRE